MPSPYAKLNSAVLSVWDASEHPRSALYERLLGSGHAGLTVWSALRGTPRYMTWFPAGASGGRMRTPMARGVFKLDNSQANYKLGFDLRLDDTGNVTFNNYKARPFSFQDDIHQMRQDPNNQIFIQGMKVPERSTGIRGMGFGLVTLAMSREWERLMHLAPNHHERVFALFSKDQNCAGTVTKIIKKGRAHLYVKPPNNIAVQGMRTLLDWVMNFKRATEKLNREIITNALMLDSLGLTEDPESEAMFNLKDWKNASKAEFTGRRKEQIAKIDEILPKYHRAQAAGDLESSYDCLILMMIEVISHLVSKQDSRRRNGVVLLARQIFHKLRKHDFSAGCIENEPKQAALVRRDSFDDDD